MKFAAISLAAAAILTSTAAGQATPEEIKVDRQRAAELHSQDPAEFRERDDATQPINFENIDYDLLAAAVFHETNRRRAEHDLPALRYKQELRDAARIQSLGMRSEQAISHLHPRDAKKTLGDRLDHVGVKGRFFAENVAMVFGIQYDSEQPFYIREEDGSRILSDQPGGPPIPPHTYLSFAESLLGNWMDSPGHRKNIVSDEAEMLGTESLHQRTEEGMDRFYCTQVFFSPFPSGSGIGG